MKVLKYLGIIIVVLVALFFIVAAFLPANYSVERTLKMEQPTSVVYAEVSKFSNRLHWDPWMAMDTVAKVTFEGPDSGVGCSYTWDGEIVGKGKITINEVVENKSVKSDLEFYKPFDEKSVISWALEEIDSVSTNVTWKNEGDLKYPMGRYMGLMMDKMLGPQFETGLNNLANFIEANQVQAVEEK